MIAAMLMRELKSHLEGVLQEYAAAQAKDGKIKQPQVFEWALPFKNPRALSEHIQLDFPYVVIAPRRIKDEEDDSVVELELSFGCYKEADEVEGLYYPLGFYDVLNLMEHVRIDLQRRRVIAGKYELLKPSEWEIPEGQPYPQWVGLAKTKWSVAAIESEEERSFLHG